MSSDSERHCCTLFQTQAFQACLRLHSPHRAPRLHRSAQALFLQRRHGAAGRGTKPLQPFECRYRGKCFQLWFTVAVFRHHELKPGLVQCSGPSVPSHQRTHPAILQPHSRRRGFCLSISFVRGWWVPSPPPHRTVPQRHKRIQYHGTSSARTLPLPWHRRCRPCLGIHCRSSGDCGVRLGNARSSTHLF